MKSLRSVNNTCTLSCWIGGEIESDEERSDVDFKLFETPKWSFRPQRPIFSAPTFASDRPC